VSNIINTLLYSMILSRERGRDIRPELYYISHLIEKNHSPLLKESQGPGKKAIPLEAYSACAEEFEKEVENTLREMLDRSVPFSQCTERSMCEMCDYCSICGRDK
jgi:hypothetical protein